HTRFSRDWSSDVCSSDLSSVALAYNTRSESEVKLILEQAEKAGGRIVKPAQRAFFGGMQGYFRDTEGHLWEVAHNPGFPIDEQRSEERRVGTEWRCRGWA